jgi:hypothetical protein
MRKTSTRSIIKRAHAPPPGWRAPSTEISPASIVKTMRYVIRPVHSRPESTDSFRAITCPRRPRTRANPAQIKAPLNVVLSAALQIRSQLPTVPASIISIAAGAWLGSRMMSDPPTSNSTPDPTLLQFPAEYDIPLPLNPTAPRL